MEFSLKSSNVSNRWMERVLEIFIWVSNISNSSTAKCTQKTVIGLLIFFTNNDDVSYRVIILIFERIFASISTTQYPLYGVSEQGSFIIYEPWTHREFPLQLSCLGKGWSWHTAYLQVLRLLHFVARSANGGPKSGKVTKRMSNSHCDCQTKNIGPQHS